MSGIDSIYILIFGTGLFGGFGHCIGMCGPLIATYTLSTGISPQLSLHQRLRSHIIYHSGRLMSYGIIGGFMGMTGSFVSKIKEIQYIQSLAMTLAGVVMVFAGLSILHIFRIGIIRDISSLRDAVRLMKIVSGHGGLFPLGLLNGFIPCGLSYTVFIAAAGMGASQGVPAIGFLKGMSLLLLFGVGTIPALLLISEIAAKVTVLKKRFYSISGIFMIASGILFIYRAWRL